MNPGMNGMIMDAMRAGACRAGRQVLLQITAAGMSAMLMLQSESTLMAALSGGALAIIIAISARGILRWTRSQDGPAAEVRRELALRALTWTAVIALMPVAPIVITPDVLGRGLRAVGAMVSLEHIAINAGIAWFFITMGILNLWT